MAKGFALGMLQSYKHESEAHVVTFYERQVSLRGYTLSTDDLRRLLKRLSDLEEESYKRELARVRDHRDLSEAQKKEAEPHIRRAHTLWTTVFGPNGEQYFSNADTNLPEGQLPKQITRVFTGNINPYRSTTNREPMEGFQVELDFSRPPLLDWANPVSSPTANGSSMLVKGDQVWTAAVIKSVEDELRSCRNARAWLHAPFAYDLGLFLFAFPFAFLLAKQTSNAISAFAGAGTSTLSVMLYFYLVAAVVWSYRLLFSYARWAFPVMETSYQNEKRRVHLGVVAAIGAAIIGKAIDALWAVFG